jgi:DNA polymerase III sliding clamp (beta) subunit (PCNA family)
LKEEVFMQIKVDRNKFRKVLGAVKLAQGVGAINNNEWTKGIKIEVENKDSIRLTASDTTTTISAVVDGVTIIDEGSKSMLLRGDVLDKITSLQNGTDLTMELTDNTVKMVCDTDVSTFEVMRDDFVGIDLSGADSWFSLPVKLFLTADTDVRFAACTDNGTRPKMQSVYFNNSNNSMDIVACDGKKLAKAVVKLEQESLKDFSVLVRGDIVNKISNALKDLMGQEGSVDICMTPEKMFVKSGNFLAMANLLDATYINYSKLIPAPEKISLSISCNKKDLVRKADMANFANKFSKDSNGIEFIGIKVSEEGFGEGCLSIISARGSSNKQVSELSVTLEHGSVDPNFCIWVTHRTLEDVLKNIKAERINIDFTDSNNPFIIRDKDRSDFLALLMPTPVSNPNKKDKA